MKLSRRTLISSGLLGLGNLAWLLEGARGERLSSLLQTTSQDQPRGTPAQLRLGLGVLAATVAVPRVEAAVATYCKWFEYVVHWQGKVTEEQAAAWDAPKVVGHPVAVIGLPDSRIGLLRFVESSAQTQSPFTTIGWTSIEIRVRDVNALLAQLKGSPFQHIGGPGDAQLASGGFRRSAQTLGLAGEVLYFTQNLTQPEAPAPGGLLGARNAGTLFIMVLAARPFQETREFYGQILGAQSGTGRGRPVKIINVALGLPPDNLITIVGARVGINTWIEIDDFPKQAAERRVAPGELSPGISLVSMAVTDLEQLVSELKGAGIPFRRMDGGLAGPPYGPRRGVVCRGRSGEMLEFIESKDPWPAMPEDRPATPGGPFLSGTRPIVLSSRETRSSTWK